MPLTADLDDVESLDIDEFVFGLRVALDAGAEVVIDKGAEDDLGGLYAHFRSERHNSRGVAAELRNGQGLRKANISSSPFPLAFDLDILQAHSHLAPRETFDPGTDYAANSAGGCPNETEHALAMPVSLVSDQLSRRNTENVFETNYKLDASFRVWKPSGRFDPRLVGLLALRWSMALHPWLPPLEAHSKQCHRLRRLQTPTNSQASRAPCHRRPAFRFCVSRPTRTSFKVPPPCLDATARTYQAPAFSLVFV
jgi:hypothetical protein